MKDGAKGEFARLTGAYASHRDRLLTYAAALVGDVSLAEDVLHDVFVALARCPSRLPVDGELAAYLTACTRNRAISVLRSAAVRRPPPDVAAHGSSAGPGGDPGQTAEAAEEANLVVSAVSRLPEEAREVVALRIWGDMSFEEIARLLDVSRSTAHARYSGALEALRRALTKEASNGCR